MVPRMNEKGEWWYEDQQVYLIVPPKHIQEQWKKEYLERMLKVSRG